MAVRLIEKLIPSSKKSRGGCRILFLHIITLRDKHIYRARKRERWEERARNASDARNSASSEWREIEKQQTKRKRNIESSPCSSTWPPLPWIIQAIVPPELPRPRHAFFQIALSPPAAPALMLCVAFTPPHQHQWENIERWELKFIARAGGISWLSKSIKSQTEEIARWGFPFWSHVCSLFADLLSSLAAHKKCHVCARALKGEIIFHRAAI